ncbi:MAG: DUF3408 domain-containing protein [Phocaeicola sp.]
MKAKKISKEDYVKTFCRDQRIRSRQTLYVSSRVHRKICYLAFQLRSTHTSTASLVDTILTHHLETYKEPIDEIMDRGLSNVEPDPTTNHSGRVSNDELYDIFK